MGAIPIEIREGPRDDELMKLIAPNSQGRVKDLDTDQIPRSTKSAVKRVLFGYGFLPIWAEIR